jgi:hypothetical protein
MEQPTDRKLEDISLAGIWDAYRAGRIPPPDAGGPEAWLLARLEEAWYAGAYFVLALDIRLRSETAERSAALTDRLLAESEDRLLELNDYPGKH